jgi:hypothetical protein
MKNVKIVSLALAGLLVGFVTLRIYIAFQNERRGASLRASQAEEQAMREQQQADQDTADLSCSDAWSSYRLAEGEVRLVRLTQGESAYFAAEAEANKLKPVCSGELSLAASMDVVLDRLHHDTAVTFLKALAISERKYAADRKTQASRICHKLWAALGGATPETQEEWTKFLARHYDGVLGNLVLGTPLDPVSAAEVQQHINKSSEEGKRTIEESQRRIEEIRQRIQGAARRAHSN